MSDNPINPLVKTLLYIGGKAIAVGFLCLNGDRATADPVLESDLGQVTNVQQLRDVAPTDWAYEALRSLVDRYSDARSLAPDGVLKDTASHNAGSHRCISGFPDNTYRGNQPLSRYEFAAGLNSCLNQIEF